VAVGKKKGREGLYVVVGIGTGGGYVVWCMGVVNGTWMCDCASPT
jgi:hypothetical protein